MNDLIPISDEQAKAVQELAKLGNVSVEAVSGLCRWGGKVLGTIPEDFLAFLIGDRLRFRRIKNLLSYQEEIAKLLSERGIKDTQPISPSVGEPLLEAAADETRHAVRELWARLIANALDPSRASRVRLSFVELVKTFDPLDAVVFEQIGRSGVSEVGDPTIQAPMQTVALAHRIGVALDDLDVSLLRLVDAGCLAMRTPTNEPNRRLFSLASKGRVLLAALEK